MTEEQFNEILFANIPDKIKTNEELVQFKELLSDIDIKTRHDSMLNMSILGTMIKLFHTHKVSKYTIYPLIENWNDIYEIDDLIIKILTTFNCEPDDMKYIINTIDTPDYNDIIEYIIEQEDEILFAIIFENINYCYSKILNQSIIDRLLHTATMYEKKNVIRVLQMKQKVLGMYKEKPEDVSFKQGESKSMLGTVDQGLDQTNTKIIDDIRAYSDKYIKSMDLTKKTSKLDISQAINIFMSTKAQLLSSENNDHLNIQNRLWGPMNAIHDTNCYSNKNSIGPCRMLKCDCREEETDTWFKGVCDECDVKIRNLSYAIRFPLISGGWIGCYCCFECMNKSPPIAITETNQISIDMMKETLKTDGIFDRLG